MPGITALTQTSTDSSDIYLECLDFHSEEDLPDQFHESLRKVKNQQIIYTVTVASLGLGGREGGARALR